VNAINHFNATILNTATTSTGVEVRDGEFQGLLIPAGYAGTAITFEIQDGPSLTNNTWLPLYSGGTLYSLTVAASRAVMIPSADKDLFYGVTRIRFVAGTAQTADVVLRAIVKEC
jgi:hypothetical protein